MKVVFDNIIFYLQKSGGISVYWNELIKRAFTDSGLEIYFTEPRKNNQTGNYLRRELQIDVDYREWGPLLWIKISSFRKKVSGAFLFHSSYFRISKASNALNIITLHDFTPELHFRGIKKIAHSFLKRRAIQNASGIICISENTRRDLMRFYPLIDVTKIRVIYNGVSNDYYQLKRDQDISKTFIELRHKKYILFVGHRSHYKNFDTAVKAVFEAGNTYFLVIVGERLNSKEKTLLDHWIPGNYTCLSGILNNQLNILYNHAHCLLYPSSYEGFGIPVAEAMRAGCPVITNNSSSIPEVAGDAGLYTPVADYVKTSQWILALENSDFRSTVIQKGLVQSAKFSWDRTYLEVQKFYRDVWQSRPIPLVKD
jgi:mannosyltransferase